MVPEIAVQVVRELRGRYPVIFCLGTERLTYDRRKKPKEFIIVQNYIHVL
ncbi:hypothetical protein B0I26_1044 [Anoxybacillus vitaminiphilus]|uniref:Uncharacterized protein n=1 Tax=Paranoxybacillus vitaminiphilus TaxID=581036 RepID=A0A327YHG6_9BACL|nr:hypothetical protein B0I26_1044 [Anoxybacillus vitaminiphilus]